MLPEGADFIKTNEQQLKRGSARRGAMLLSWSALALFFAFIWLSMTCCMCGHASAITAMGVGPALLGSLWGQWKTGRIPGSFRFGSWLFLAGLLLLSGKVVADILWFGHEPLLP